jgi:cell division septation protein DedD
MEEQPSWKNHTFTLMVFGGIVVLCAIFFTLGMLVGRTQSQKIAGVTADAAKSTAAKDSAKDERPELTFYDSVDKKQPPPLEPLPGPAAAKPEPAPEDADAADPVDSPVVSVPARAPARATAPATPPAPVPAKPAPAVVPPARDFGNFQIDAFSKSETAERLVEKLKGQGFHAFMLDPVQGDKTPLYRVQVGPVADQVEADALLQKLKTSGYPHPILKK